MRCQGCGGTCAASLVLQWPWGMLYVGALARAGTGAAKICPFFPEIPGTEHPHLKCRMWRGRAANPSCSAFSCTEMDFNCLLQSHLRSLSCC